MNAERNVTPRGEPPRNHRLEDFGFGSTLAAIAAAVLAVAVAPALGDAAVVAGWLESCTTLVMGTWPGAGVALGLAG